MDLTFERVSSGNVDRFKKLLVCLFPTPYPPSFVKKVCDGAFPARIVVSKAEDMGCLCWVQHPDGSVEILTFGVLVLHRERGLGSKMLDWLLNNQPSNGTWTLAVHVRNSVAVEFYKKRGFVTECRMEHYYHRLEEPHAYKMVLKKMA